MKAIIMAGGLGTRLAPVTGGIPKPMVPLLGRPVMEHIILLLRRHGFTDICAALRYRAGDIIAYFGDGSRFGVNLQYRIEDEPLGTAGGVKNCADFYGEEDFLVISGDAACDFDLARLMSAHRESGSAATLALYRHSEPLSYGLAVTDERSYIRGFVEKPDWPHVVTDLVNTGIYVLSPLAMSFVPSGTQYDFARDLFPLLLRRALPLYGMPMSGYWCDIGDPLSYYRCCADALTGKLSVDIPEKFRPISGAAPSEAEPGADAGSIVCPCRSRAELMGALSDLFLEMDADYSNGLSVSGERFRMNISPLARRSAVKVSISSDDEEYARELAVSAENLIKALDL